MSGQTEFNRRQVLAGVGAALVGGAVVGSGIDRIASAQDSATPVAVQSESAATPVAEEVKLPVVPPEVEQFASDWPMNNRDYANHRDAVTTIDSSNVGTLGTAWNLPIDAPGFFGAISAPVLILGDTLYTQDMTGSVYSINREDGSVNWKQTYDITTVGPNGVAVGYGLVFGGQGATAEAFALDASTGDEVWRFKLSPNIYTGVDMAPSVYDGKLYISTVPVSGSGGSYQGGGKGTFFVLDAMTGGGLWDFDTTSNLWGMPAINAGGGLWYPPAIDDAGNIYFGTGNPAPFPGSAEWPNGSSRPGDNLYASSMVSLDPTTGAIRWYLKPLPRDLVDHDFMLSPVLATVDIDGADTLIAIGGGKNGLLVAVNAETGDELWRVKAGKHQNDDLTEYPLDEAIEVYPGAIGGFETPVAYRDGVLYATVINMPSYAKGDGFDFGFVDNTYQAGSGEVIAVDVATGTIMWDIEIPSLPLASTTLANDLIFIGGIDGQVHALNVADGSIVWSMQFPSGINAPLTIAGDTLIVAAGGPLVPEADATDVPTAAPAIHLLRLGLAGTEPPTPEPAAASPESELQGVATGADLVVIARDIYFEQTELSAPANTDVHITLKNAGAATHDISIPDLNVTSNMVAPGESDTITINAAAGTYVFLCTVPGHAAAGMVGKLTLA